MMNKYTHHLSVAFVVSLEKFPTISHKKIPPRNSIYKPNRGRGVLWGICRRTEYVKELLMVDNSIY